MKNQLIFCSVILLTLLSCKKEIIKAPTESVTLNELSQEVLTPIFEASMTGAGNFSYSDNFPTVVSSSTHYTISSTMGSRSYSISLPLDIVSGQSYSTLSNTCLTSIRYVNTSGQITYANCSLPCKSCTITITAKTATQISGKITGNIIDNCTNLSGYTINSANFTVIL